MKPVPNEPPEPDGPARLSPHDSDAEAATLGAMLLRNEWIVPVAELVTAADFWRPQHGLVFDAIIALHRDGQPVDPVTVVDRLHVTGQLDTVGGPRAIAQIVAGTPGTTNVDHYARIVAEHATRRRLMDVGQKLTELGERPGDVDDALAAAKALVGDVAERAHTEPARRIGEAVPAWIDDMEARASNKVARGLKTGLWGLDGLLGGGLKPGKLYIFCARPKQGKSSLAAQVAGRAAHQGVPAFYASMEMTQPEILERVVAQIDVPGKLLTSPNSKTPWDRVAVAGSMVQAWPLHVHDARKQTTFSIAAGARATKKAEGRLGLIVVDYLTLMQFPGNDRTKRYQQIGDATKELRQIAGELHVPVVCLAQLKRLGAKEPNRRPTLEDLRESGDIEQDADVVVAIHHPTTRAGTRHPISHAELIVLAQRAGPSGITRVAWVPSRTLFANVARPQDVHTPEPPVSQLSMESF